MLFRSQGRDAFIPSKKTLVHGQIVEAAPDALQIFLSFPVPLDRTEVPDLFTAIQEQLGLKLESTKGLVEIMVIDSIQKPTEN